MIDFIKKFFKPEASGATARERLRLVLLSDHLSLAPDVVDALRADLIAVISKYVEVDEANCDVTFEQQDSAVAMLANIPILSMRSRPMAPPPAPTPPAPPAPTQEPSFGGAAPASASVRADEPAVSQPKRRKRRRRAGTGNPSPAPG
jgi:cell division topological specificity factor